MAEWERSIRFGLQFWLCFGVRVLELGHGPGGVQSPQRCPSWPLGSSRSRRLHRSCRPQSIAGQGSIGCYHPPYFSSAC